MVGEVILNRKIYFSYPRMWEAIRTIAHFMEITKLYLMSVSKECSIVPILLSIESEGVKDGVLLCTADITIHSNGEGLGTKEYIFNALSFARLHLILRNFCPHSNKS